MSYTKGPWGFEHTKTYDDLNRECFRVYGLGDVNIAKVSGDITEENANAHLIAAAPDLLEACESSLEYFYRLQSEGADGFDSVIEALEQAISKAEGKD